MAPEKKEKGKRKKKGQGHCYFIDKLPIPPVVLVLH
jgi:hypothetical protein